METDWQINLTKLKDRGQYLLKSMKLSDCRFLVGTSSNQCVISGHRLLLAMASPVFEVMFYGSLPEKDNLIAIPDIEPDTFKAMLDYMYTDEISISSFDSAIELYCAAKKYMLPHVVNICTNFLMGGLSAKNVCRAYEFGKLYEEPRLITSCMELIVAKTREVIADPSFIDIEVSTLMAILDQDRLNIDSELDLFNCLLKYANERGRLNDVDNYNITNAGSEEASGVVVEEIKMELEDSSTATASTSNGTATTIENAILRHGIKKIRFLAMTAQQFAEGPARTKLLNQNETFAILVKISSPTIDCPMPEGFSQLSKRNGGGSYYEDRYCISAPNRCSSEYYNANETNSRLSFKVDTNIYLLGIRIKFRLSFGQIINRGNFSACVKNFEGSQIASTNSLENVTDSQLDITFNSPVFIHPSQIYLIQVTLYKICHYTMSTWYHEMVCNAVKFSFYADEVQDEPDRSGLINSIIFST